MSTVRPLNTLKDLNSVRSSCEESIQLFEKEWAKCDPLDFPLLKAYRDDLKNRKPFKGLKILHNNPLTVDAIFKIEPLSVGGAEVTVTSTTSITSNDLHEAVAKLKSLGITVNLGRDFPNDYYDYILDCCGELASVRPKVGAVELTKTGSEVYQHQQLEYPVILIDDSQTKRVETFYGTGDACIQALSQCLDVSRQSFLIFGYGKVGRGVVNALQKSTGDIVICDIKEDSLQTAKKNNINAVNFINHTSVSDAVKAASVIITSTGILGFVSKHFVKKLFEGKTLVNIGALDEYGDKFLDTEVLNSKQPLNFAGLALNQRCFLDPTFYAHNMAIELLKDLKPGAHSLSKDVDIEIVKSWERIQNFRYELKNVL